VGDVTGYDREEPGVELHDWESVKASIDEDIADDPDAGLSQLADLVHRMLVESGYAIDDDVAGRGAELEVVLAYRSARETTERAELGEASRGDVESAIDDLRDVFAALVAETGVE
jgi:hypothetical protein